MDLPSVSILLPTFNEDASIDACMASLASQVYGAGIEVIVADGGSTDRTLDRLQTWMPKLGSLKVISNPERVQSHGINHAAEAASGEILIRADAHSTYAADYVERSVAALQAGNVTAVGGPQIAQGLTPFGKAVAAAMGSPLAIGSARFRHAELPTLADTVYLGAIRRSDFLDLGGLRTMPSGVAEDSDFYFRLRAKGGKILVDPSIRSVYRPRETPRSLWRQFYRYGIGKMDMLFVNGRFPSMRPWGPLLLVLALIVGVAAAAFGTVFPLLAVIGGWVAILLIAGRGRLLVAAAAAIMQLSYGLGMLRGLLRSPSSVRASVGG
jgi:glycosyltransferase involved in cell wall biosynthesis